MVRRAQIVLSVVLVVLLGIATNVATGVLPSAWQKHLWVAWPLLLVIMIAAAVLEVGQKDERPADFPATQARRELIQRVHRFWVTGVLQKSLYNEARIELDLLVHESADRPWDIAVTWSDGEDELLPPGTGMAEVFERMGRRIVILGAPGAGKTTMLLELARSLLEAAKDEREPIPVVLPLTSWARHRRTIGEWIIDELVENYGMPRQVANEWLRMQQILPLFDGLDEVDATYRQACVRELNRYLRSNPTSSAVCCRKDEYQLLREQVKLHGVVTIEPLTAEQTQRFLGEAGPGLDGLKAALVSDPDLWTLASSPLLLSIMALAYRDGPEPATATEPTAPRHRLYGQYIRTMLRWRKNPLYPPATSLNYLHLLAARLHSERQTVFTLDLLNASWLPRGSYLGGLNYTKVLTVAPACLLMFVAAWPLAGTNIALVSAGALGVALGTQLLSQQYDDIAGISWKINRNLRETSPLREPTPRGDITSNSVMKSFIMAGAGFMTGGLGDKVAAFAFTAAFAIVLSVREAAATGPAYSIIFFVSYLLVSGVIDGFMEALDTSGRTIFRSREVPSPALRPRVRLALRVGLAWGLITGFLATYFARMAPAESLPPGRYGALIGLAAFLWTFVSIGGGPLLEQRILRHNLSRLGLVPNPCLPFLDFMDQCLMLRRVGNGYIFVHRELLDFLADRNETEALLDQD